LEQRIVLLLSFIGVALLYRKNSIHQK
jgi:hypothetical protein